MLAHPVVGMCRGVRAYNAAMTKTSDGTHSGFDVKVVERDHH